MINLTTKISELNDFRNLILKRIVENEEERFSAVHKQASAGVINNHDRALEIILIEKTDNEEMANEMFVIMLWSYWEAFAQNSSSKKVLVKRHTDSNWFKFIGTKSPINELRLIRNCLLHCDKKVSQEYSDDFSLIKDSSVLINNDKIEEFSKQLGNLYEVLT